MYGGIYSEVQQLSRAVIFAGGSVLDYDALRSYLQECNFVVCADSGMLHCNRLGLSADLWVGDFDSSDFDSFSKLPAAKNAQIIKLNPIKDDTDTEFALDRVLEKGYKDILLIGGIGTRLDHSFANILLMEKALDSGAVLTVVNEQNILHFVRDDTIYLERGKLKYVSVLPIDNVIVTNSGFVYPLKGEELYRASSRGISNEYVNDRASITVDGGAALVIESVD